MSSDRISAIRARLEAELSPTQLDIVDESHLHAGHPGARDGRGHFAVRIASSRFTGLPQIARHRLVYQALDEMMKTDIHALSVTAVEPSD